MNDMPVNAKPAFYTVREAARTLRVAPSTLYRVIRDGEFPAIRLRTRYVVPAIALERLLERAAETGGLVDPARIAAERRATREFDKAAGGAPW